MTSEDWNAVSAVGSILAGFSAFAGLLFIGIQIKAARKTADLQALQTFLQDTQKYEERLLAAKDSSSKESAFNDLLNFLELNAAAMNDNLFSKTTRRMAMEKLADSILIIESAREWHDRFCSAMTTETTFEELSKFYKRERKYIDKRRGMIVQ